MALSRFCFELTPISQRVWLILPSTVRYDSLTVICAETTLVRRPILVGSLSLSHEHIS